MKRHPALVHFSRDHHAVLVLASRIRKGIKKQVPDTLLQNYVIHAWPALREHFRSEEALLPALPGINRTHPLVAQFLREHRDIEATWEVIAHGTDDVLSPVSEWAEQLENHVRFEERQLFPFLESTLPPEELDRMTRQAGDTVELNPDWGPPFWTGAF